MFSAYGAEGVFAQNHPLVRTDDLEGDVGIVLGIDGQQNAPRTERREVALEVLILHPGRGVAELDAPGTVLAHDPAPQRVVEVHHDALAGEALERGDVAGITTGHLAQHAIAEPQARIVAHLGIVVRPPPGPPHQHVLHVQQERPRQVPQAVGQAGVELGQPATAARRAAPAEHAERVRIGRVEAVHDEHGARPRGECARDRKDTLHGGVTRLLQVRGRRRSGERRHQIVDRNREKRDLGVEPPQLRSLGQHLLRPRVEGRHVDLRGESQRSAFEIHVRHQEVHGEGAQQRDPRRGTARRRYGGPNAMDVADGRQIVVGARQPGEQVVCCGAVPRADSPFTGHAQQPGMVRLPLQHAADDVPNAGVRHVERQGREEVGSGPPGQHVAVAANEVEHPARPRVAQAALGGGEQVLQ